MVEQWGWGRSGRGQPPNRNGWQGSTEATLEYLRNQGLPESWLGQGKYRSPFGPGGRFTFRGPGTDVDPNTGREAFRATQNAPQPQPTGDMNYALGGNYPLLSWADWRRQQGLSPSIPGLGRVLL
jgi:hypothetical protein